MNRLRLWIASLAATSFLAGGAGGLLLGGTGRAEIRGAEPFEDYQRMFLARFDLSPERTWLFSELIRNYDRDIEDLRQTALENSMAELTPELNRLGNRYRDMIRNNVLPEDQRPEFDRLALATAWPDSDPHHP